MGEFVKWRDDWKLGIEPLDRQHRQMTDALNRLVQACHGELEPGVGEEEREGVLAQRMDELYRLTRDHFRLEERMMQATRFPGHAEHAREHALLLAELKRAFAERLAAGCCDLDERTLQALKTWFVVHVSRSDREFADYIAEHDIPVEQQGSGTAGDSRS
ncbi:MAG TPA: bacteriohemerythrin [Gammaproteobacteria bacterium]|nr:bacteriohemerythrin [Gammaproteobacteria bacterium]